MNKLDAYLKENNLSGRAFARQAGLTDPYLSKIRSKIFIPSLTVAYRIERITEGAVPATSWVDRG